MLATWSGRSWSGRHWLRAISCSPAASSHSRTCRSVITQPGVMVLTRMWSWPSEAASPRVSPLTDDLAMA